MYQFAELAFNEKLIDLKKEKGLTASKLAELAGINIDTIKSWLVDPESKKWRKLSREMFYLIKSKILFLDDKKSLDHRSHVQFLSNLVDTALLIAKNSIINKQPLEESDLTYIEQAMEVNGILSWHLHNIIPADQEEIDHIELLKNDNTDYNEETEQEVPILIE
jgi:transcriptional regulator with XRE-family HTH domain